MRNYVEYCHTHSELYKTYFNVYRQISPTEITFSTFVKVYLRLTRLHTYVLGNNVITRGVSVNLTNKALILIKIPMCNYIISKQFKCLQFSFEKKQYYLYIVYKYTCIM